MSVIHAPKKPELDLRMLLYPGVLLVVFSTLTLRLWYFQVVQAPELVERAQRENVSTMPKLAPRGLIYDRKGKLLAGVRPELVITAVPSVVRQNPWVLSKLAGMLKVDQKKLEAKVKDAYWKPYLPSAIFVGAPIEVATRVAEAGPSLPGLGVETQPMRFYPDTTSFTHLLGYAWVPSERDVERLSKMGIKPAQYVGKAGLEYVYEKLLMGAPGAERTEVDARRHPLRIVGRDSPTPGTKLILSIDSGIQKVAQTLMKGYKGAVVAIDPNNGEVLCLVSSPTYDLGLFEGGISNDEYAKLSTNDKPQINRAIYGTYSPGSTFKIVTSLATYKEGKFNPNETVYCPGYYSLGKHRVRCLGHHGAISFQRALAKSCNTYFATLAVRSGPEAVKQMALAVGLGDKTGIDLPGESKGIVPTDEWIARWRNPPIWYKGDTVNMGIGQGELQCTPLQMCNLAALVAMRGTNYVPHLVHAVGSGPSQQLVPAELAHHVDASDEFWNEIHGAMVQVIEDGTAGRAKIPGVTWGAKTGSTENRKGAKTHAWFIGFAPAEHPKIAVAVVMENVGHGGEFAAPIAAQVVKRYLLGAGKPAQ